jgi:uncharacterized protein YbaR (Trm112 family)
MRGLSASELLGVWEDGLTQPPILRALTMLAAGCPQVPAVELAQLSVGRRDAGLLALREATFGSEFLGVVVCPNCKGHLELSFEASDVRALPESGQELEYTTASGELEVRFRLPDSFDLAAASVAPDLPTARQILVSRCVLGARELGEERRDEELPTAIIDIAVEAMAEVDPQADARLAALCPSCGDRRPVAFDIATFLWEEIRSWAGRTLRDVHALAKAYGWQEAEILAMSPERRQAYLDLGA